MNIELLDDNQDNGKRIVPYTTPSGLQIGRCYTPRITPTDAQCIERHTKPKKAVATWGAVSFFAVMAVFLMVRHHV